MYLQGFNNSKWVWSIGFIFRKSVIMVLSKSTSANLEGLELFSDAEANSMV